jgi:hypothetical protein
VGGTRVRQGIIVATEMDGRNPPMECNILVTCRRFFRGEHAGDICNVCREYLAMRYMDSPA